jgi:hypothetical protein
LNPETHLLQLIRLALAEIPGVILWRNSIGYDTRAHCDYGIQNPGGSDLIGFVTERAVLIEFNDIPSDAARFLAIEVKTDTGVVSPEQRDFIALVRRHGGIAGVARSVADAKDIVNGYIRD